ncbi:MAG: aldehyde ferredoxin oxidoreductase family protein [Pseudomonadota bacterium]|nr:aldehyde ferredoxin oxidoreductase family protein [Pseudomonadota bacterium]
MSWQGRVLRVDLTSGGISTEPLNMQWAQAYLGERGLGTKYLCEEMDPRADPLGPDNALIFVTGPLTGTLASTGGRYAVVTKGPLTGAIACSNSGGTFGAEFKMAGYDLIIIKGQSPEPVYLCIENEDVRLLPADKIWGRTVWETDAWIKLRQQNPQLRIAAIGEAGERGVRYACIINDLHRAAGRSGVGAVMGSKRLKAIAVRGTRGVAVKDPARFMEAAMNFNRKLARSSSIRGYTKYGTHSMLDTMQEFGGLPTRNFRQVQFEGAGKVNVRTAMTARPDGHRNLITNYACFGCTIACGRISHIDRHHFTVVNRKEYWHASGGIEYEMAFAFGPVLGIDDIDALTFAAFQVNEHGMDPISFGVTLAAAMELYELGAITREQTDGVEFRFGNAEALTAMVEKTGKGEGFGRELGLGSKRLCEKYGHPELSMTVKGQEFAGYDARAMQGMGLGYATSNRGACHLKHNTFAVDFADQTANGKAEVCKTSQDLKAFLDSSGLCIFTKVATELDDYRQMIDAACPGEWSNRRLCEIGERIWNLERLFNLEAGLTAADDTLPPRMLEEPAPGGAAKGKVNQLDIMLPEYYRLRGWTDAGVPTVETLRRLKLNLEMNDDSKT